MFLWLSSPPIEVHAIGHPGTTAGQIGGQRRVTRKQYMEQKISPVLPNIFHEWERPHVTGIVFRKTTVRRVNVLLLPRVSKDGISRVLLCTHGIKHCVTTRERGKAECTKIGMGEKTGGLERRIMAAFGTCFAAQCYNHVCCANPILPGSNPVS